MKEHTHGVSCIPVVLSENLKDIKCCGDIKTLCCVLVVDYFFDVKFVFTRGRIKLELLIQTQSLKFWSHKISILSEGRCRRELCEGIRGARLKMKIVFFNIFFSLPVLWAQHQFLSRSPLLSVGRRDKVDPLLENIKASSPSCTRLSYLLFECHISGIRSICFLLSCAQDGLFAVLRAACWDQCHRGVTVPPSHAPWGNIPPGSCSPCAYGGKGRDLSGTLLRPSKHDAVISLWSTPTETD